MFASIARFELRYQLRNPVFWVVAVLFFLLTFGSVTVENIQIGSGGNVHKNSPFAIATTHQIMALFFMFVTTAFVANVIVRDDETGFGPLIRATRVGKTSYLLGRFTGAFAAAALAFTVVPLAIWLGSLMPWVDPETLGPNRLAAYLYAYFVLALPGVFLTSAIFFALATVTRSMMATYLGVVAFLVLYTVLIVSLANQPQLREVAAYAEPFGLGAVAEVTRYWTAADRNTLIPPVGGVIGANRLIWLAVALAVLGLAVARFRLAERPQSRRAARRQAKRDAKLVNAPLRPVVASGPLPVADPERARLAQFWAQTRLELRQTLRSPAFFILLLLGLANSVPALIAGGDLFGTPIYPVTRALVGTLQGSFALIPIIVAIYYAGELVWRDRDRRVNEIIDSTPLPDWAFVVPKTIAVTLVLLATLLVGMIAALGVQAVRGGVSPEFGKWVWWWLLPGTVDAALLAALAVFVQALSPSKYVGWGVMVVYLVATVTLANVGLEDNLYLYAGGPSVPLSDMNANGGLATGAWWFRVYWGACALGLLLLAHLLWRRGTDARLSPRMRRLPGRFRGGAAAVGIASLALFAGTGGFIYHNTHGLNDYRTAKGEETFRADYEKALLAYESVPQPSVSAVRLNVALFPGERRAEATGRYQLTNDTGAPVRDLHVRLADRSLKLVALDVPGAKLARDHDRFNYRIYLFDQPMAPGETRTIGFKTERHQVGFRNSGNDTRLVENGTFLSNQELAPVIGMSRQGLLSDRAKRRSHGLAAELRPAKLEDRSAQAHNYVRADWTSTDITVSTAADQTPIAPGRAVADRVANGRHTTRFVSGAPILNFYSIQSARYDVRPATHDGIDLAVYYDPQHSWNVDRMIRAMKLSLDYYQANFAPYQFKQLRILEFPGYASFAQAFANTVPYSETIGFVSDNRDPDKIDYVTYVTAHEVAHQYWAHQVVGADMQGASALSETLAQYSALMVMKHLYGPDRIRRFLRFELDSYLRSRGGEAVEELPLERVEGQGYIHYRKGSLVMYLLADRMGEDAVNRALRQLIGRYAFKGAPYPRSLDLVAALRAQATTPAQQALITDLFERITLYDLRATEPTTRRRPDGRWETSVTVNATKVYADGQGRERPAPLNEAIAIGAFAAEPGEGAFSASDVLALGNRPVRSGVQRVTLVTKKRPLYVGVDPYNMFIDRNSQDNVVPVK